MKEFLRVRNVFLVILVVFLIKSIAFLARKCLTFERRVRPVLVVEEPSCAPTKSLLFLKTHKTGGSTVSNILYRYADIRNLTVVLPKKQVFSFFWPLDFQLEYIDNLHGMKPDILCNHARYNRGVMHTLLPTGSPFITILREPLARFESAFFYEDYPALFGIQNNLNPLQYFLENLMMDQKTEKIYTLRNGMSFDLGLNPEHFNHTETIQDFIKAITKDFDLVLIMEHFDESLVLMKKKLCWRLEDMVYVKHNTRIEQSKRLHVPGFLKEKFLEWHKADVMLYSFFNDTLWKQINSQNETFWEEVKLLKEASVSVSKECLSPSKQVDPIIRSVTKLLLKENISHQMRGLCEKLIKKEDSYLELFRARQKSVL